MVEINDVFSQGCLALHLKSRKIYDPLSAATLTCQAEIYTSTIMHFEKHNTNDSPIWK